MIPPVVVRVLLYVATVIGMRLVGAVVGMVIRWADQQLDAPIMRQRINSASDDYFEKERLRRQRVSNGDLTIDLDDL